MYSERQYCFAIKRRERRVKGEVVWLKQTLEEKTNVRYHSIKCVLVFRIWIRVIWVHLSFMICNVKLTAIFQNRDNAQIALTRDQCLTTT